MSKDIMVGKTEEEIDEKETSLDLGDDFFSGLHSEVKKRREEYPLLWKLVKDFYEHVFYANAEVKGLISEIDRFLASGPKVTDDHVIWLNVFKELCTRAVEKGMTLFCVAD